MATAEKTAANLETKSLMESPIITNSIRKFGEDIKSLAEMRAKISSK